jgi:Dolichyl-phosphate-mannose-protein mannosyltransferase
MYLCGPRFPYRREANCAAPCAYRDDRHHLSVVTVGPRRGQRISRGRRRLRPRATARFSHIGSPSEAPSRHRLADAIVLGVAVLIGLVAIGLATASFASFESVKARLDAFASDGDADVTRGEFDAIVLRVRVAAVVAALAALAVYVSRHRLVHALDELAASATEAISSLWRAVTGALATESRLHLAAIGVVTLIALLVRLEFLFQPMRYDEAVTFVHFASQPWYIALTNYAAPNNHVFHSLLVHFSTLVFGDDPWAVRLPAFVAGIALVPASYVAARVLYGKDAALVAAALVAGSSVLIEYSTNARGYTLMALVFVLLLALAAHLQSSWNQAAWLVFALVGAVGFYIVPVMLYAFGAVVVWLTISLWPDDRALIVRRLAPSIVVTGLLSLLLYAPILASSGLDALVGNEFVESLSWRTFTSRAPDSLVDVAQQWHRDAPLPLVLLLLAGFVIAVACHRRLSRFAFPPALAALVWIVPLVIAQRVVPFERVWLFLVPLYLMTAAAGLVYTLRPVASRVGADALATAVALGLGGLLAAIAVATQSVYESEETSTFRDADPIAALLEDGLRSGEKVLVAPPADGILEYEFLTRGMDPAALLYWRRLGTTQRLAVVVQEGPRNYTLPEVLADERLEGVQLGEPAILRRFDEASLYEVRLID